MERRGGRAVKLTNKEREQFKTDMEILNYGDWDQMTDTESMLSRAIEDLEEVEAERDRYKNELDNLIHSRGVNGETLQEYGTATHRAKELRADLDHCEDECARLKEGLKKAQGYAVKILDARDALQDRLAWKEREVEIKSQHIGTIWGVVSSALGLLHDDPDKAGQLLRGGLSKVQMHPMGYCTCAQAGECGWCEWNERSERGER